MNDTLLNPSAKTAETEDPSAKDQTPGEDQQAAESSAEPAAQTPLPTEDLRVMEEKTTNSEESSEESPSSEASPEKEEKEEKEDQSSQPASSSPPMVPPPIIPAAIPTPTPTHQPDKKPTYQPKEQKEAAAKAVARGVRISARKARLVANMIRGKYAGQAFSHLNFTHKKAARIMSKLLKSAATNLSQNSSRDDWDEMVIRIYVDEGPTMRRWRPRAQGRASPIRKRTCSITLELVPE